MTEREPVERWVPVDADDVETLADGEEVETKIHEIGEERGEIERTDVTIECVGGTPETVPTPWFGYGAAVGALATGAAMAIVPYAVSADTVMIGGVVMLAILVAANLLFNHAAERLGDDDDV